MISPHNLLVAFLLLFSLAAEARMFRFTGPGLEFFDINDQLSIANTNSFFDGSFLWYGAPENIFTADIKSGSGDNLISIYNSSLSPNSDGSIR